MEEQSIERGYLISRLGRIHFATSGKQGDVVLLLPQSGRSWVMFAEVIPLLSDRFTVVAIDYPGSGCSDRLPEGTTIPDMAGMVIDVLDGLGADRAHIYGLHIGNKIGAALGARHPQRLRNLILAGQSHSLVADASRRSVTVGRTRRKLLETRTEDQAMLVQWSDTFTRVSSTWWSEGVVRDLTNAGARARAVRRAVDELQSMQGMAGYYRANYGYDLAEDIVRIAVPTLVLEIVTPSEDALIGRQGKALAAMASGALHRTIAADDEHGITLDDRAEELAVVLCDFFGTATPLA